MPTLRIATPAIHETIVRPTTVAITDQVIDFLRLKKTIEDIRYITHSGDVRMPSSGVGERSNDYASFAGTNRAWIEVEEEVNEGQWATSRPDKLDTQPLFHDAALGVTLRPFMSSSTTTLKFRFTSHNRDTLVQTRNHLSSRIASLEDGIQHTVQFAIGINDAALRLLNDIWAKRETVKGYGDNFIPYLKQHSSSSLTTVSESSGNELSLVFQRTMGRVNGYFIVSPVPNKPAYQETGSVWEWELEYKVNYDVPSEMFITYPIMVHNQYLNPIFLGHIQKVRDIRDRHSELSSTQISTHLVEFGRAEGNNLVQDRFIRIPHFDDFEPEITLRNSATVVMALLSISEDNSIPLLNLAQLGDFYIEPAVLDFFRKGEYRYINKPFQSFFALSLYEGDSLMDSESIYCDENLNVFSSKPLNPRKVYHFRFSLIADFLTVDEATSVRTWNYPEVIDIVVRSANDAIRNLTDSFQMTTCRKWEPWMLGPAWKAFTGKAPRWHEGSAFDARTGVYSVQDHSSGRIINNPVLVDGKELPGFTIPQEAIDKYKGNVHSQRLVQVVGTLIKEK